MASMYELIMDLPLFKGVSKTQISQFLEKTHVGFRTFEAGETIVQAGEGVSNLMFLISGEAVTTMQLQHYDLAVKDFAGPGKVFGGDRLYGISTEYPFQITATQRSSIMEFSKPQYQNLLLSDPIYLLNFLNFISRRAQRGVECFQTYDTPGIHGRMAALAAVLSDPETIRLEVEGTEENLSMWTGSTLAEVATYKAELTKSGIAKCSDNTITIINRNAFLEF